MPFRFKCRNCKKIIYIEKLNEEFSNYPCTNCYSSNEMTAKEAIEFFNIEEIIEESIECPNCKKPQNDRAVFCKDCGTEISPKKLVTIAYCNKCKSEFDESSQFCENDGDKLVLKEKEIDESPKNINDEPNDSKEIYNNEVGELPMKWYKFLTYFLFPFPLFVSIVSLPFIDDSIIIITIIISGIFSGVTIYGLYNKTAWSWKLLILTYLINSLSFRIDRFDDVGLGIYIFGIIVINVIVTYPNYIYFNKRKHLFNN